VISLFLALETASQGEMSNFFEVPDNRAARNETMAPSASEFRAHPRTLKRRGRLVVCALQTYSRVGGLQNFNKRVVANLAERTIERHEAAPLVVLLGDERAKLPERGGIEIRGFDHPLRFIFHVIRAGFADADLFMISHINLLPIAVLLRCLKPKVPILLFVHGDEVWNSEGRKRRWYEPLFLHCVSRIASVSTYTATTMAREFSVERSKFRILPNAVDPAQDLLCARNPARPTILTVTRLGRRERRKHVDQVIKAVALLRHKVPGLRYEIIGEGVLRPELEALARTLRVDDIVSFLGRVDDAGVAAAYARANVFALPSSKEGFGIVYLEAWQHGLPVLCASQGAAMEIVLDGADGYVVDPADVDGIVERLLRWLTDPGLARAMGECGRKKVENLYLNKTFRANLDQIIDELLETNRG
jgi:phosphatidylinositol alpha-1,6-mannosyltransferase